MRRVSETVALSGILDLQIIKNEFEFFIIILDWIHIGV